MYLFKEYFVVINAIRFRRVWKNCNFCHFSALKEVNEKALLNIVLQNINSKRKSKCFYSIISKHSTIKLKVEDKWEEILINNAQRNWISM